MSDADLTATEVIGKLADILENLSALDDQGLRAVATGAHVNPDAETRLRMAIARLLTKRATT